MKDRERERDNVMIESVHIVPTPQYLYSSHIIGNNQPWNILSFGTIHYQQRLKKDNTINVSMDIIYY